MQSLSRESTLAGLVHWHNQSTSDKQCHLTFFNLTNAQLDTLPRDPLPTHRGWCLNLATSCLFSVAATQSISALDSELSNKRQRKDKAGNSAATGTANGGPTSSSPKKGANGKQQQQQQQQGGRPNLNRQKSGNNNNNANGNGKPASGKGAPVPKSAAKAAPPVPALSPEEEEKRRKRAERFNAAS